MKLIMRFIGLMTLCFGGFGCQSLQSPEVSLCSGAQHSADCHYFKDNMPYIRGRTPPLDALTIPKVSQCELPNLNIKEQTLSIGDIIRVQILDGDDFSADVEVDSNGYIFLPYLPAIPAKGKSLDDMKKSVKRILIEQQLMHPQRILINIAPLQWAPIEVTVAGAVFEPGQHMINRENNNKQTMQTPLLAGDHAQQRTIAAAIRSSGGIKPNADLSAVIVTRQNRHYNFDLRGIITGKKVPTFALAAGDHIFVTPTDYYYNKLVRPSQLTIPGMRISVSNLTTPGNTSTIIGSNDANRYPYGSRLLDAAVGTNCVGGSDTNSARYIVLITRSTQDQQIQIVERSITSLMKNAWRDEINPQLMPGDSLACYDSGVTNMREIAKTITDFLIPIGLLGIL
ncbi:polysaccharide biosynthesis/export family protein [Shewanella marina]|uniref:polysaccharide biosynthesis/export family protein n=1 Tax=Shewanella marina TaxID=487319 RepID=UPI00046FDDF3|nr:polysaccharide biosynthesis/export family protein [Shewanella marina]